VDIVQQIFKGCQRILELSLHFLEKRMNFQEFEERLWETMNGVGRLRVVLEAKDEEIHRERDRTSFQVVRKNDQRTILTLFGDVTSRKDLLQAQRHQRIPAPPRRPDWFQEEEKD